MTSQYLCLTLSRCVVFAFFANLFVLFLGVVMVRELVLACDVMEDGAGRDGMPLIAYLALGRDETRRTRVPQGLALLESTYTGARGSVRPRVGPALG